MNLSVKPIILASSSGSLKSDDGFADQFPTGLRVIVVDDDLTCLRIMEMMLKTCLYEVTKCNRAELALQYLRENKNGFDIVISDVHMPDMDGFKLLEHVGLEMDLPVIMMSADDSRNVVMKGITHGACDYLIKPVRMEALKNIWQHVVRKKKHDGKDKDVEQSGGVEDGEEEKPLEDVDYSSSANERNLSRKRKDEEDDDDEGDDSSTLKKPRVVWSNELHQQFMTVVNHLGMDKAVPKKILELMSVPGLTRENVASHLQKFRIYLKKINGVSLHHMGIDNSFIGPHDVTFGRMSSVGSLDFQAVAAASPFSPQNLASIQIAELGRTAASSISVPSVDQRVSFENPGLRPGEGQLQQNNNSDQINLLHGIPTNMNSKHLAALHQSAQPFGGMNMHILPQTSQNNSSLTPMIQRHPQFRPQSMFMARNGNNDIPSNVGQSLFSSANLNRAPLYLSIPQPPNALDFSKCHNTGFSTHNFSVTNNAGISNLVSQGMLQEIGSEMKGPATFASNYGGNGLNQNATQDWGLQYVGSTFKGETGGSSSVFHQGFSNNQKIGQSRSTFVNNGSNFNQQLNSYLSENSLKIDSENLPNTSIQNDDFTDHYTQDDDYMAALLKQEGTESVENGDSFDIYNFDIIPS